MTATQHPSAHGTSGFKPQGHQSELQEETLSLRPPDLMFGLDFLGGKQHLKLLMVVLNSCAVRQV